MGRISLLLGLGCLLGIGGAAAAQPADPAGPPASVVLPMDRTAYFAGEKAPLGFAGLAGEVSLEAVGADGRALLYRGPAVPLLLDTAGLAPGDYRLEANGQTVLPRLTITGTLRRSVASLQDESPPREPRFDPQKPYTPDERREIAERHWDAVVRTLRETGLSAVFHMASDDTPRQAYLDALARAGTILLANPDTRPTSSSTRNAPRNWTR